MEIGNKHILKDNWLMYKKPYSIKDMRFDSPLIDKEIYDAFNLFFTGIAIELSNGKKYVSVKSVFDKEKKEYDGMYYINSWKVY